jgi:hypothetical protein
VDTGAAGEVALRETHRTRARACNRTARIKERPAPTATEGRV